MTLPRTATNRICKGTHSIKNFVDGRDNINTVDHDATCPRCAKCNMKHRAIFSHIDLVSTKHRINVRAQSTRICEAEQQFHSLRSDTLLGIIHEHISRPFDAQRFCTCGITLEHVTQMRIRLLRTMSLQSFPLWKAVQRSAYGMGRGRLCSCHRRNIAVLFGKNVAQSTLDESLVFPSRFSLCLHLRFN